MTPVWRMSRMTRRQTALASGSMSAGIFGTSAEGIGSRRLRRLGRVSPRSRLTFVGVGAGPRLPIDALRRLAGEVLPALDRDLDVLGVDLHRVAAPAEGLGRHERRAGT